MQVFTSLLCLNLRRGVKDCLGRVIGVLFAAGAIVEKILCNINTVFIKYINNNFISI